MRAPLPYIISLALLGAVASITTPAGAVDSSTAKAFERGEAVDRPPEAVQVQACSGFTDAKAFKELGLKAGRALGLTEESAARTVEFYVARCASPSNGGAGRSESGGRKTRFDPKRSAAVSANAARTAEMLNQQRGPEDIPASAGGLATGGGSQRPIDYKALNALPASQPYAMKRSEGEVPGLDHHSLGDSEVAPAPTLAARARSLITPSAETVAEDFKTLQAKLANFELPPEAIGMASSNAPLASFVQWVKTMPASDLPEITYGIVREGHLGNYAPGLMLSPGKITMNHYIRNMPADERSAVLFHELYHHWDRKVERLQYANEAYNYIDPDHMPEHEYDAYYMTALYWQKIKQGDSKDALARCLDRYPTNPDAVRAAVARIVGGKK